MYTIMHNQNHAVQTIKTSSAIRSRCRYKWYKTWWMTSYGFHSWSATEEKYLFIKILNVFHFMLYSWLYSFTIQSTSNRLFQSSIHFAHMSLDCESKPEHPKENPIKKGRSIWTTQAGLQHGTTNVVVRQQGTIHLHVSTIKQATCLWTVGNVFDIILWIDSSRVVTISKLKWAQQGPRKISITY